MSQDLVCALCGPSLIYSDDDYCPIHGEPLRAPTPVEAQAAPGGTTARENSPGTVSPVPAAEGAPTGSTGPATSATTAPATPPPLVTEPAAPIAPGDATPPPGAPSKRDRIADFFSKFKSRSAMEKPVPTPEESTAASPIPDQSSSPLPEAVLRQGWRISGPVESPPGLHHWPVVWERSGAESVTGHYHRFRTGALTTDPTYRHLESRVTPQLARIWAHGTVESSGAREDFELVSLPKAGRRLHHWCAEGTPSEQRAWYLLPRLVALLESLAGAGVRPLVLDPSHLQVASDGELWLATAAILTVTSDPPVYRPGLEHSALLPKGWSAPELTEQNMATPNAVVFSVGQLLALALWGQPCSPADLKTGAVPFASIADARLAQILMGCLWPRYEGRWSVDDLRRSATAADAGAMPDAPPWDSLSPGALSTAFSFAGASYWRLEVLLAAAMFPAHWDEATARIRAILDWADDSVWQGQVKLMRTALDQGRSPDWVLVALNRIVRPDSPMTWRNLDLTDAEAVSSLAGLAQRALRGEDADVATLRALFEADLRGAFVSAPPQS